MAETERHLSSGRKRVTINDVAARAGVSITAVSRALNRPRAETRLSPETYEAVLDAARQLNYRPSWNAQSLAKGSTGNVGVLFTGWNPLTDSVFSQLYMALSKTFDENHYRMMLIRMSDDPDRENDWRAALEGRQVDACVVSHGLPSKVAECLRQQRMPAVLMNLDIETDFPRIVVDDGDGIRQATRHLIDLGHRRIAYLYRPRPMARPSVAIRREGFLAAMHEAGLSDGTSLYLMDPQSFVDEWRSSPQRATAVVCYSHAEAVDLYQALWRRGLTVPNDLSVVAFNDVFPAAQMTPPLTVMALPFAEIGRLAAERVLRLLGRGSPETANVDEALTVARKVLPLTLVGRESSAPPGAG